MTNELPEGVYQIKLHAYWTRYVETPASRKAALVVDLVITDGSYVGEIAPAWYNVRELFGTPRQRGTFRAKNVRDPRNRYAKEYRQITGKDELKATHMSPAAFKGLQLEGRLVCSGKAPKFNAVWNPNRPGAERMRTMNAPKMHLGCTQNAPRMYRKMHPHDAPNHTADQPESRVIPSSPGDKPDEDLRVSDLRDRDVGEEEKASMGGYENGSTCFLAKNKNIDGKLEAVRTTATPPPGVGKALWNVLDKEGRAWIGDYAEYDETNDERLSSNTASQRRKVSTLPRSTNREDHGAYG